MTKSSINVPVYAYCSNEAPALVDVPCHVVGRLAVHRSVHWFNGQEPVISDRYWTVSQLSSGKSANSALPSELREAPGVLLRDLKAWAEAWQLNACVVELLDAFDLAVEQGTRFSEPKWLDRDVIYACREAGWAITKGPRS